MDIRMNTQTQLTDWLRTELWFYIPLDTK